MRFNLLVCDGKIQIKNLVLGHIVNLWWGYLLYLTFSLSQLAWRLNFFPWRKLLNLISFTVRVIPSCDDWLGAWQL